MNLLQECDVCGSSDSVYDELSSELLCQVCGAVFLSERTQIETKTAEYQRSFLATTSIDPLQEHVKAITKEKEEHKVDFDIKDFTLKLSEQLHTTWGLPNVQNLLIEVIIIYLGLGNTYKSSK